MKVYERAYHNSDAREHELERVNTSVGYQTASLRQAKMAAETAAAAGTVMNQAARIL